MKSLLWQASGLKGKFSGTTDGMFKAKFDLPSPLAKLRESGHKIGICFEVMLIG